MAGAKSSLVHITKSFRANLLFCIEMHPINDKLSRNEKLLGVVAARALVEWKICRIMDSDIETRLGLNRARHPSMMATDQRRQVSGLSNDNPFRSIQVHPIGLYANDEHAHPWMIAEHCVEAPNLIIGRHQVIDDDGVHGESVDDVRQCRCACRCQPIKFEIVFRTQQTGNRRTD